MDKFSSQSPPTTAPPRLLILDLDETLIYATEQALERPADFRVANYHVYQRPFLTEFLERVRPHFELAGWSSAGDDYVREVVAQLFPADLSLAFVWGQSRCTYRRNWQRERMGYLGLPPGPTYHYVKPLKKLRRRGYRLEHLLIVDDSPHKSQDNYGNAIYPREFRGDLMDRELLGLSRYLLYLKSVGIVRSVEKRGWWQDWSE